MKSSHKKSSHKKSAVMKSSRKKPKSPHKIPEKLKAGKKRYVLKGKVSLAERKVAAMEARARALEAIAKVYVKNKKRSTAVSDSDNTSKDSSSSDDTSDNDTEGEDDPNTLH